MRKRLKKECIVRKIWKEYKNMGYDMAEFGWRTLEMAISGGAIQRISRGPQMRKPKMEDQIWNVQ